MPSISSAPAQREYRGACSINHLSGPSHLYGLSVYSCPNGHAPFYSYAVNGAVSWSCPDCGASGEYIGCDGEAHTLLRKPRPVLGQYLRTQLGMLALPETQEEILRHIQAGISEPLTERHYAVQGVEFKQHGQVDQLLVCAECCTEHEFRRVKAEMLLATGRYEWARCEQHEQQYQMAVQRVD